MASLKIIRDSGYADRTRAYVIILDGKNVGELRNGETKEFPVSPGQHDLSLKIDWCGSETCQFTVTEGETLAFRATSNLRGAKLLLSLWYVLFARNSYLQLDRTSN